MASGANNSSNRLLYESYKGKEGEQKQKTAKEEEGVGGGDHTVSRFPNTKDGKKEKGEKSDDGKRREPDRVSKLGK